MRVEFGVGGLEVGLAVHPLVQPRALEAPAVAQLESGHEALRGVLVERVGGDAEVLRGLANVHDLAHLRDQQVGTDGGAAHDCLLKSRVVPGKIPALLPVVLYITRFHPSVQGFSGSYRKLIGFRPPDPGALLTGLRLQTQPVGPRLEAGASPCAITTDGALRL